MSSTSKEARVILTLAALQNDKKLSLRAMTKLYNVPVTTLYYRRAGRLARRDLLANSRRLTDSEEKAIVQYVLELYTRSFPPRLCGVEDMANQLLRVRDAPPVGKLWAHNCVKRQPELRTRYTRRYDYQRAKCEDPKVIGEWFALVRNVKAKYGIVDDDIYNFDETGFMMGIIFAGMVATTSDGCGKAKLCHEPTVKQGRWGMQRKASANRPRPGPQPHTQVAAGSGLPQVTKIDKGSRLPRAITIARGSWRSKASQGQRYSGQRHIMYIYQLASHSLRELGSFLSKQSQFEITIKITGTTVTLVVNPLASPSLYPTAHTSIGPFQKCASDRFVTVS